MKPLYFKRFTLATNASTWLPRQPPIQMDKTVHRSQSSQIVKQQSASESNEPNQDSVLIEKIALKSQSLSLYDIYIYNLYHIGSIMRMESNGARSVS